MQVDLATRVTVGCQQVRECLRVLIEVVLEAAERVRPVALTSRRREKLLQRRVVRELIREVALAVRGDAPESRRRDITHVVVAELSKGSLCSYLLYL